ANIRVRVIGRAGGRVSGPGALLRPGALVGVQDRLLLGLLPRQATLQRLALRLLDGGGAVVVDRRPAIARPRGLLRIGGPLLFRRAVLKVRDAFLFRRCPWVVLRQVVAHLASSWWLPRGAGPVVLARGAGLVVLGRGAGPVVAARVLALPVAQ